MCVGCSNWWESGNPDIEILVGTRVVSVYPKADNGHQNSQLVVVMIREVWYEASS